MQDGGKETVRKDQMEGGGKPPVQVGRWPGCRGFFNTEKFISKSQIVHIAVESEDLFFSYPKVIDVVAVWLKAKIFPSLKVIDDVTNHPQESKSSTTVNDDVAQWYCHT